MLTVIKTEDAIEVFIIEFAMFPCRLDARNSKVSAITVDVCVANNEVAVVLILASVNNCNELNSKVLICAS